MVSDVVSDVVSDLRWSKGLKNQGKMMLPPGIEPRVAI
jgi:hypothetical protein